MKLTANNKAAWLATVWEALHDWEADHEYRNAAGGETFERRYDDICTAMAWIAEELGVEQEDV